MCCAARRKIFEVQFGEVDREGDIRPGRKPCQIPRHCRATGFASIFVACVFLNGCSGIQSALDPAGDESDIIATLFWVMVVGGTLIWVAVIGTLLFAASSSGKPITDASGGRLILWGGAVFPSLTLLVLLAYALWLMPGLRPFALPSDPSVTIEVSGKQFWWQVAYRLPDGSRVHAANEVRLPVGKRVEFALESDNVIHSFWIPALGGKMDMIPGRTNRLSLLATKPGTFRAPCAEYCGTSHALMAFSAVAMDPAEFDEWLAQQARPAAGVADSGAEIFLRNGCGACHRVDGTEAEAAIGPDLSHVGSRLTLGAGILPNTEAAIARFIADPASIKPDTKMPAFGMLPPDEIAAMSAWLKGLK